MFGSRRGALFTVAGAGIFGWLIAYLGAADIVVGFITGVTTDPYGLMLLLIGFLLLIGTVLNPISAVLIFLPIIQALGDQAGIDPVGHNLFEMFEPAPCVE